MLYHNNSFYVHSGKSNGIPAQPYAINGATTWRIGKEHNNAVIKIERRVFPFKSIASRLPRAFQGLNSARQHRWGLAVMYEDGHFWKSSLHRYVVAQALQEI